MSEGESVVIVSFPETNITVLSHCGSPLAGIGSPSTVTVVPPCSQNAWIEPDSTVVVSAVVSVSTYASAGNGEVGRSLEKSVV